MHRSRICNTVFLLACTLVLAGCPRSIEELVEEHVDQLNAQVNVFCECWDQLGFESNGSCISASGFIGPSQLKCVVDAFERQEDASRSYLECQLPLWDNYLSCLDEHLICDEPGSYEPCVNDYNVGSRDCIELPNNVVRALGDCAS